MSRILSIEDDGDFQHLIGLQLRRVGYDVHYAFTGEEGYEKALLLDPDLILLDMMLPILNGAEVLAKLREHERTRHTPVIVVTAFYRDIPFLEEKVRSLGIVEYLRKPVRMEELHSVIKRLLGVPSSARPVPKRIERGALSLCEGTRTVWFEDHLLTRLAPKRFAVLRALALRAGTVRRAELVEAVWNGNAAPNTLEKTVERLRRDLAGRGPEIVTEPEGYRLAVET